MQQLTRAVKQGLRPAQQTSKEFEMDRCNSETFLAGVNEVVEIV